MPAESRPPQHQDRHPGLERDMHPQPRDRMAGWQGTDRLDGKVVLVTGGDSGIGRAVAIGAAKEGADVAILYLDEHADAADTIALIEATGRRGLAMAGDIGDPAFCREAAARVVEAFGRIDVLVNNAAEQHVCEDIATIDEAQVERTFRTNILGMFWLVKAALPSMPEGGSIVNTTSITAYKGNATLVDYASTKGAIVAFTRSLSQALWKQKKIRVNAVAPGPIWTPLIPASFTDERTAEHGASALMERAGEPDEVAPSFLFLMSARDSSYITGQVLHPNGGSVVNG